MSAAFTAIRYPFIAFTGLATCGKTTAASALCDTRHQFKRVAFADPLKAMVAVLTEETDKDARPPELCGRSVREAYQLLGTEWGRNMIGEDVWLRAAHRRFTRHLQHIRDGALGGLIVDDCRFANEAKLVRELGGIVVRIVRPGLTAMLHASELGFEDDLVDHVIYNDGELFEFVDKVHNLVLNPPPPDWKTP